MSQENVEIVRRVVEAFNEGGVGSETALSFFDAAAVFEEPPEQPGASVAHGLESVSRLFTRFDETWEEHRCEVEEIRPIDDERVLLLSVEHLRGRDGLELAQPMATVFTLRAGRIVRMRGFWERANGLEAVGLRE